MSKHHLISIDEDQLRQPVTDQDEFFRNVGTAVVLACLEPKTDTVSIKPPNPETNEPQGDPIITIRHVAEHDRGDFEVWVWACADGVAIAELSPAQLEALAKIVRSQQKRASKRSVQ